MIGFPFDSQVTYESDGTPVYDRAISSAPLRELIKKMLTNGVLPNPSTNLQVQSGTGMTVVVNPGFAVIEGGLKYEETQRTLVVQASDATYDRIDTVVMRWNDNPNARNCDLYVVQGAPASTPVRPELNRSSSVYEIGLADLFVAAGSSAISMARITDTRYEAERCGIISSIAKFDSDAIYRQVQADLAGFKENEQAEFLTWFEMIRGQLSEDAAGNLQNQMEDMRNSMGDLNDLETTNKSSVVAAMNELFNMSPETVDPMAATMPGMAADALAVKEQFNEQNKNLSVRYNVETDEIEIFYNGKWESWKSAGLQLVKWFNLGVLDKTICGGISFTKEQYASHNGSTYTADGFIKFHNTQTWSALCYFYTEANLPINKYKEIEIEYNFLGNTVSEYPLVVGFSTATSGTPDPKTLSHYQTFDTSMTNVTRTQVFDISSYNNIGSAKKLWIGGMGQIVIYRISFKNM